MHNFYAKSKKTNTKKKNLIEVICLVVVAYFIVMKKGELALPR